MKNIIIFFVLFPVIALSQSSDNFNNHRFSIKVSYSPDYCYRFLRLSKDARNTLTWPQIKETYNSEESPKYGYTTGIFVNFQFNNKIGIESGLTFSNRGYTVDKIGVLYDLEKPSVESKLIYNYYFLDVPIIVSYSFFTEKTGFFFGLGASVSIPNKSTVKIIPFNPTDEFSVQTHTIENEFDPFHNRIPVTPIIKGGFSYKINSRFNIQFAPTFRYSFLKLFESFYISKDLWSAGLDIGLNYRI